MKISVLFKYDPTASLWPTFQEPYPQTLLLPRSPNLQSVLLTELARLKDPMLRKRDCLQQAIDNDQALMSIKINIFTSA